MLTPRLIVAPEFPREARERRQSGHVDVEAVLAADGRLTSWTLRPDSEASRVFVAEIEQVIGHWRWHPAPGAGCVPADAAISTRVWFEWEDDEPKVFVRRASRVVPPAPAAPGPIPKRVKTVNPEYPRSMLRAGIQAQVHALSRVGADGNVLSVGTVAYADKKGANLRAFEKAVEDAIAQWKFEPRPEGPWRQCTTVNFRLSD